jgi:hypothetical protein
MDEEFIPSFREFCRRVGKSARARAVASRKLTMQLRELETKVGKKKPTME